MAINGVSCFKYCSALHPVIPSFIKLHVYFGREFFMKQKVHKMAENRKNIIVPVFFNVMVKGNNSVLSA